MSKELIVKHRRFRDRYFKANREYLDALDVGLSPQTCFVSCDRRMDPATVFDVLPGEKLPSLT